MTEDLATQFLELSQLACFQVSRNGVVTSWNRAAEGLYGYSESEAVGRGVDFLSLPGERTALVLGPGGLPGSEANERHRHRDGAEIFVELRLSDSEAGFLVCARDASSEQRTRTGLAASREALGASHSELRRIAGQVLDAQEAERRRIARELHDDFKQRLVAHSFQLAALAECLRSQGDGEAVAASCQLDSLVDQVADLGDGIRRISHELHPDALERLGLAAALETHAAEVETRQGLAVLVTVRDGGAELPDKVALALYRVAQEALENAVRHSGARQAHVTLVRDQDPSQRGRAGTTVRLAITDDGRGFRPDEVRGRGPTSRLGLGLAAMAERARLLGGRLRIASEPGAGTEIEIAVPVADEAGGDGVEAGSGSRSIGPYRLLEVLGEGATATVYLAQEPPPLARKVAVKLYRVSSAGFRKMLSFKTECQALAKLRHPNVGRIHEARSTENGAPYIVMEYVPGMPITEYCDRYRLNLRQRIELLVTVCEAVQHVHQKGVLHRDLKPANVLVMERDGTAIPKIVDFGIAKGLDHPLAEGTVWTHEGAGTPAYVSPEVLAGGDADTRSDVYALGVMLYQLLTGVLPAESEVEILGQLAGNPLPLPSRRLAALEAQESETAAAHRLGAGSLVRSLRGDLDWIVAKALAPEPEARYVGAAILAEDLERHLNAEPVLAGPPSLSYRLTRLARRHRAAVTAGALALVALVGGLVATAWQARRASQEASAAEQARQESEQVTEFLEGLFQVADPGEAQGNTVTAREILDRGAERLDRELAGRPRIRARLQQTVGHVYSLLGLYDAARPLLEESLQQCRELFGEDHAETATSLRELGHSISEAGSPAEAQPLLEKALAIQERMLGEDHLEVAETLTTLAFARRRQGEQREPTSLFRRAHEIVSASLPTEHPRAINALLNLGLAYRLEGDPEQARIRYLRALELGEEHLGLDHPDVLASLRQLAVSHADEADYGRALAAYERLLPRLAKVHGPDHWRTLRARLHRDRVALFLNRNARAQERANETLKSIEKALGPDHWLTVDGLFFIGNFARLRGQYDRAEEALGRALRVASATELGRAKVAALLIAQAQVALSRSDPDRAETLAISVLEGIPDGSPRHDRRVLSSHDILARVALARGDLDRAEASSREILSALGAENPEAPILWSYVLTEALAHLSLGKVFTAHGDADRARRSWELAAERLAPLSPGLRAQTYHAVALLYLGRVDEARPIAREALRGFRYPELIELCERHGIEVPPVDG